MPLAQPRSQVVKRCDYVQIAPCVPGHVKTKLLARRRHTPENGVIGGAGRVWIRSARLQGRGERDRLIQIASCGGNQTEAFRQTGEELIGVSYVERRDRFREDIADARDSLFIRAGKA